MEEVGADLEHGNISSRRGRRGGMGLTEQVSSASREIAGPGLVEVDIVRQVRARHPRTRECG